MPTFTAPRRNLRFTTVRGNLGGTRNVGGALQTELTTDLLCEDGSQLLTEADAVVVQLTAPRRRVRFTAAPRD